MSKEDGPDGFDLDPAYVPMWTRHIDDFQDALAQKLERGFKEYGDASFTRSTDDLLTELSEEALDIAGWGFVMWVRIRNIQKALEDAAK